MSAIHQAAAAAAIVLCASTTGPAPAGAQGMIPTVIGATMCVLGQDAQPLW